ncbi:MAG: hypothetical protein IJB79_04715 [Candidatus Gastranaerophilales bacterium]|nr:hypothetical protein [Candidatus Gastranaerophilales bacterium]
MNINSLNSVRNVTLDRETPKKWHCLNALKFDSISFCGKSSTVEKIEFLKTMPREAKYSQDLGEIIKVYEHFGFVEQRSEGSHHTYIGPYGQIATFVKHNRYEDCKGVDRLVAALNRLDEFDGELIIFQGEPSQEQIDNWKEIIATRTPLEGHCNKYALEMKQNSPDEQANQVDEKKEQEKLINNQKIELKALLKTVEVLEKEFESAKNEYEYMKNSSKEAKVSLSSDILAQANEVIQEIQNTIVELKEKISAKESKLKRKMSLTDSDKTSLDALRSEAREKITQLENIVDTLLEEHCAKASNKEKTIENIDLTIDKLSIKIQKAKAVLDKANTAMNEARFYRILNINVVTKIDYLIEQVTRNVSKVESLIFETRKVIEKNPDGEALEESFKKINKVNESWDRYMSEVCVLDEMIEKEVLSITAFTQQELAESASKKVDEYASRYVSQTKETQKEEQKQPEVVEVVEVVEEQPVIVEQKETKSSEKVFERFKAKMAQKLSLVSLPAACEAYMQLLDEKLDFASMSSQLCNAQNANIVIKSIANSIANTKESARIKNATRFALLHSVYLNSKNPQNEIYNLNSKQARQLFDEISLGKTKISILNQDFKIDLNLNNKIQIDGINEMFKEFNEPMSSKPLKLNQQVLAYLISYVPRLTNEKIDNIQTLLRQQGGYFELLANENCAQNLREILLEEFFKAYDEQYGTNISEKVMQNYKQELEKIEQEKQHQEKLDLFESLDWTL